MSKLSFLIIDDNSIALKELADILKYIGHKNVKQANNANNGWAMIRMNSFDCIISAWDMPDMTGLALLRIARSDDNLFDLPFFLTDSAFTKVKVIQAGQSGVTGLIVSPYDVDNIKTKIDTLAEIKGEIAFPPETEEAFTRGIELIDHHDYKKALVIFEDLVNKGESAEYYYNIGYIKTAQENYPEAIAAFRKATQIDHMFAKAFEAMGRAYNKLGRADEAQEYLQKAADIYISDENVDYAEEILNEILSINPDTINVYNSLGVLYRKKGDLKTAMKQYEKALIVHPNEPRILYNMGRLYLDLKDINEAKKFFARSLMSDPEFREARDVLNAIELGAV